MDKNLNRRSFLKSAVGVLAGVPLLGSLFLQFPSEGKAADLSEKDILKDSEGPAKGVNYCPDAEKSPKTCPARSKPDRKGQLCNGCQFYTKAGTFKGAEFGSCLIFASPKKMVKSTGWCQSWIKHA